MRVAILGSGLAAAFAAQAAKDLKAEVEVISDTDLQRSTIGAQWLHWIPGSLGNDLPNVRITIRTIGNEDGYLHKQWQDGMGNGSSFPKIDHYETGWSPETYLPQMWEGVKFTKIEKRLTDHDVVHLSRYNDYVFHTFPSEKSKIIRGKHFVKIPIVVETRVYLVGIMELWPMLFDSNEKSDIYTLYNGDSFTPWVRMTYIPEIGQASYEYPFWYTPSLENPLQRLVYSPDLMPGVQEWRERIWENVYPIGRYAKWSRKYLSHQAYSDVFSAIKQDIIVK